jgi:membrane protein YdbS with pleckstrin-like domain
MMVLKVLLALFISVVLVGSVVAAFVVVSYHPEAGWWILGTASLAVTTGVVFGHVLKAIS